MQKGFFMCGFFLPHLFLHNHWYPRMVSFVRHTLANGLRLLVHTDNSTPLVAVCLSYDVGTRDENPDKTGFAHLFEHLMFGGSKHAPDFDDPLQKAGGENNAFTNQDMTVYYEVLPRENIETALWLEADRMAHLTLNKKALEVQRKVVIEEFKETCLNEPYGDIWHHIGALAYKVHPYSVPTIGKTPQHIADATLGDVKHFFESHYCPNNAVLSIAGNIDGEEALSLVEKWFGAIPAGKVPPRQLPAEPQQTEARSLSIEADVPLNALFICFHCAARKDAEYYIDDILTDLLGGGESAILYQQLVKKEQLFSEIDAYLTGTTDTNLFIIEGKLSEETSYEQAEAAIWSILEQIKNETISPRELQKLKNRVEHSLVFSETSAINKAISLGYFELLGNADDINEEAAQYNKLTPPDLQLRAQYLLSKHRASTIYYRSKLG